MPTRGLDQVAVPRISQNNPISSQCDAHRAQNISARPDIAKIESGHLCGVAVSTSSLYTHLCNLSKVPRHIPACSDAPQERDQSCDHSRGFLGAQV